MKVDYLEVTVKYKVGLGGLEMPVNVKNQLIQAFNNGKEIDGLSDSTELCEWLTENIREADAMDLEYEIKEIEL